MSGLLILASSSALLALNLVGLQRARNTLTSWDVFAQDLPHTQPEEAFCQSLTHALAGRFEHGPAQHTPLSNYLSWALGRVSPRFGELRATRSLFRHAPRAMCGQIAQAFVDLSMTRGVTARVVGLNGHVVAEAYYDGMWHGFDPDYEVVFRAGGRILSVRELAEAPALAREVYAQHRLPRSNDEVLDVLARQQLTPLPAGAHGSPRLLRVEQCMEFCKWLVPLAGIGIGIGLIA